MNLLVLFVGHPWVQDEGVAPDKPLDPAVLTRLTQFSAMNKLKKMAFRVSFGCGSGSHANWSIYCYNYTDYNIWTCLDKNIEFRQQFAFNFKP